PRAHQRLMSDLAGQHRLPAISWDPEFPRAGGLMCYSVTVTTLDQYRQAAGYVDRILKGAKASDLPIQQGSKYTLVINLKTAKALGLTVPLPPTGLDDEVIERSNGASSSRAAAAQRPRGRSRRARSSPRCR